MTKKTLFAGLLAVIFVVAFGVQVGSAVAQNNGASEKNPTLLPSSRLYFLKDWQRKIQSVFAFSAQKKAELELRFFNERLSELKKMIEKAKNPEKIEKATQKYQEAMDKIANRIDRIKENASSSPALNKFLNQVEKQQTLHQNILEKLESKAPTSTLEKIKEARGKHLEKFEQVKEKLREKIGNTIIENDGACSAIWKPVCSEDGKTFANACQAKLTGAKIKNQGICPESIELNE